MVSLASPILDARLKAAHDADGCERKGEVRADPNAARSEASISLWPRLTARAEANGDLRPESLRNRRWKSRAFALGPRPQGVGRFLALTSQAPSALPCPALPRANALAAAKQQMAPHVNRNPFRRASG